MFGVCLVFVWCYYTKFPARPHSKPSPILLSSTFICQTERAQRAEEETRQEGETRQGQEERQKKERRANQASTRCPASRGPRGQRRTTVHNEPGRKCGAIPSGERLECSTAKQFCTVHWTPRKYVFDVTSIGQRSSPWTCNSVKAEIKFHLECKLHFPNPQLMLRQMHLTNLSESMEAKFG